MERIKDLLDKISDAWNYYFLDYKFCQKKINFTEDVGTNYYGDILSYFNDTLVLLENIEYKEDFNYSIFQAVGILQIIYAQQDLIDELLFIFKLPTSLKEDKNPNRNIRNELVGHPIRRNPKTKEFISSVFYHKGFENGMILYTLYTKQNSFPGKNYSFKIDDILKSHMTFLEKYLLIILKQVEKIFINFQKALIELELLVRNNADFYKTIKLIEFRYSKFFLNSVRK